VIGDLDHDELVADLPDRAAEAVAHDDLIALLDRRQQRLLGLASPALRPHHEQVEDRDDDDDIDEQNVDLHFSVPPSSRGDAAASPLVVLTVGR
jgi:hypothetical protein